MVTIKHVFIAKRRINNVKPLHLFKPNKYKSLKLHFNFTLWQRMYIELKWRIWSSWQFGRFSLIFWLVRLYSIFLIVNWKITAPFLKLFNSVNYKVLTSMIKIDLLIRDINNSNHAQDSTYFAIEHCLIFRVVHNFLIFTFAYFCHCIRIVLTLKDWPCQFHCHFLKW